MPIKHTEDFKQETVRMALRSGLPRRWVASDLGIGLLWPTADVPPPAKYPPLTTGYGP